MTDIRDTGERPLTSSIREAIRMALQRHLPAARLDGFNSDARLNEDLGLDSIMLMELLVTLELESSLRVSEDAFIGDDLHTVADLTRLLAEGQREALT